jgi:hypothetical protein
LEKNDYFILIACDEFQRVTKAFRDLGFTNTFSCDIGESHGDMPAFHIDFDILNMRKNSNLHCKNGYIVRTIDGVEHKLPRIDMVIIALESMSASYGGCDRAIQFLNFMYNLPVPFKVIESPIFPERIASFWGLYIEHCQWYNEYLQTRRLREWN